MLTTIMGSNLLESGNETFNNNSSSTSTQPLPDENVRDSCNDVWLVPLQTLLLVAIVYVAVGMLLYGRQEGKFRRKSDMDFAGGSVFVSSLFALSTCLCRVLWSTCGYQVLHVVLKAEQACHIFKALEGIISIVVAIMIDLTLWLRQRLLLAEPCIASSFSLELLLISRYSLPLLIACWLLLLLPLAYFLIVSSPGGCSVSVTPMANRRALMPLIFCVFNQCVGLFMFVFPLKRCQTIWRRRKQRKRRRRTLAPTAVGRRRVTFQDAEKKRRGDHLDEIITRIVTTTLYAGVIGVVPHLLVPCWQLIMHDYSLTAKLFLGDFAITFNLFGILFTIVQYQCVLLLPLFKINDLVRAMLLAVARLFQDCGSLWV